MSVQGSGNKPYIPEDHGKVEKPSSKTKKPKDKSVSDLKQMMQGGTAEKTLEVGKVSKKSTMGEKERKTFEQEAEAKGYKFSKTTGLYQSIEHPEEMITVSEMESLVQNIDTTLLPEIFEHILLALPNKDLSVLKSVSTHWDSQTLKAVKERELALLKSFKGVIEKNVQDKELAKEIVGLIDDNKVSESNDLQGVQTALLDLRDKLVATLKNQKKAALINFESFLKSMNHEMPLFLDKTFLLAAGYTEESHSDRKLYKFATLLATNGMFEEALKSANTIESDPMKNMGLKIITEKLIVGNQLDRAFAVIDAMSLGGVKIEALKDYSNAVIKACTESYRLTGKFSEESLEKAYGIFKEYAAPWSFADHGRYAKEQEATFDCLVRMERFDVALTLADTAKREGKYLQNCTCSILISCLLKYGKYEEAIKSANIVKEFKDHSLLNISNHMMKERKFDKGLEVIEMINDLGLKNDALEDYSDHMIQACLDSLRSIGKFDKEDLEKACDILKDIPLWKLGFQKVPRINTFKALIGMGQADLANMLANAITNPLSKGEALKKIEDLTKGL